MTANYDMSVGHVAKHYSARIDLASLAHAGTSVMNFYSSHVGAGMVKRSGFRLITQYLPGNFNIWSTGNAIVFGRVGSPMYCFIGMKSLVNKATKTIPDDDDLIVIETNYSINQYAYADNVSANSFRFLKGLGQYEPIPSPAKIAQTVSILSGTAHRYDTSLGKLSIHVDGKTNIIKTDTPDDVVIQESFCENDQSFRKFTEDTTDDSATMYLVTPPGGIHFYSSTNVEYTASTRFQQRNILAVYDNKDEYSTLLISSIGTSYNELIVDAMFGTWYSYERTGYVGSDTEAKAAATANTIPVNSNILYNAEYLFYKGYYYSQLNTLTWHPTLAISSSEYVSAGTAIKAGGNLVLHRSMGRVTMLGAIDASMFLGTENGIYYTLDLLTKPITRKIFPKGASEVSPVNVANNLIYVDANGKTLMYVSKPPDAPPVVQPAPILSDFAATHGGIKKMQVMTWSATALIILTHCGQMMYVRPRGDNWSAFPWCIGAGYVNDIAVFDMLGKPDLLYAAVQTDDDHWLCVADEPQFVADVIYNTYENYNLDYSKYLVSRTLATKLSATSDFFITTKSTYTETSIDVEFIFRSYPVLASDAGGSSNEFVKTVVMSGDYVSFGRPILAYWQSMVGSVQRQSFGELNVLADKPLTFMDIFDTGNVMQRNRLPGKNALELYWQVVPVKFNLRNSAQRVMFFHSYNETVLICGVRF